MTPKIAAAVLVFFGLVATPAFANDEPQNNAGCALKLSALNTQLEQARNAGNIRQQAGLEKALKQAKANCTDAGLKKQRIEKTDKARKEVSQRKADLTAAMQSGDVEKINTRQRKLAQSQQELDTVLARPRLD